MTQGAVAALPLDLDLTLVSRRPARLREETFRTAMNTRIPVASGIRDGERVQASIVIVTHKGEVFTRLCLASLLGNTEGPGHEVTVVDNASQDGTAEYVRAVAGANPHVRLILNRSNRGFAAANNQGLAEARGDVLVLLNNDTIVPPGWLGGLIQHLEESAVGLVGPVTNRIGNEAEIDVDYRTYGEFLEFARRNRQAHEGRCFDIPTPCMFCLAMRREAYERIGPLDERFEVGMLEDDDYALRARAAGYRAVCAEDVLVHHFGQASFGSLIPTGEYGRVLGANKDRFEKKWGRPPAPYARRPRTAYEGLKQRMRRAVCDRTPPGAVVLIVSKGDTDLLDLVNAEGRTAWHFPQTADGTYAGWYPADSEAVIAHLETLRSQGAEYLLFPATARWWLEYYGGMREHLEAVCGQPLFEDEACLLFGWETNQQGAGFRRKGDMER